ncbi:MAG: CoA ester lyase [Dehalococcoidia bacterium]|nr:CoA ester lyase [Dehalococcoidia bacterium]
MLLLRSLLFVPGNQERRIEKARSVAADALILDLEDSVPASEKEAAREMVAGAIAGLVSSGREIFVRVNSLTTPHAVPDIQTIVKKGLTGILLAKSESATDIRQADVLIAEAERKAGLEAGSVCLLALVESPLGIINAYQIATASPRLIGMTLGAEDYTLEMGVNRTKEGAEIFYPRQVISVACHAAGVLAIDCVFTGVKDPEGLIAETTLARQMGFQGKLVIHPDQVEPVNEAFVPPAEEVAFARRVLAAYEIAIANGKAAAILDGKMIDTPVAEKAKKLLAQAEKIANR